MLPKNLFVALLFAVYIDRSFEAPEIKVCRSDLECVDIVKADDKLKHGIVIFIVIGLKGNDIESRVFDYFHNKPVQAILMVHNVRCIETTGYLLGDERRIDYPIVSAMNNSRVVRPVLDKNQLNRLDELLENAINPTDKFAPGINDFITDMEKRIEEEKIIRESSKRKRDIESNPLPELDRMNIRDFNKTNQINFPAATIAQGNKQREKEIIIPRASKSQWTKENTLWREFGRLNISDSNTPNQINLPATEIHRGTSQTSPKPASPEEHDAKRRRGKGSAK